MVSGGQSTVLRGWGEVSDRSRPGYDVISTVKGPVGAHIHFQYLSKEVIIR